MSGIVRRTLFCRVATAGLFASALAGCPVDERTLLPLGGAFTLDGGAGEAGSGSRATGGEGGSGGESGEGGAGGQPPDIRCVYVEGEPLHPDCDTLVANAGFTEDVTGWAPENTSIIVGWDARDATDVEQSGSIGVNNQVSGMAIGTSMWGAFQCLPVTSGGVYEIAVDVFIPKGQTEGQAGITIFFFGEDDCTTGMSIDSYTSPLVNTVNEWVSIEGTHTAPAHARAMSVRLVAIKPFEPPQFRALFDNVLVKVQ